MLMTNWQYRQQQFFEEHLDKNVSPSSGVYAITLDSYIVYIGRSKNMQRRCIDHYSNIFLENNNKGGTWLKYVWLKKAVNEGHILNFHSISNDESEEIAYIKKIKPIMNIKDNEECLFTIFDVKKVEDIIYHSHYTIDNDDYKERQEHIIINSQYLKDEIEKLKRENVELRMDLDDARKQIEYLEAAIDEGWFD